MLMINPQHLFPSPSGSSGVGNALPLQAHLALEKTQWEKEVDKMVGWGADVKAADRPGIVDYLASQFKP
jgi:hypothetical protein